MSRSECIQERMKKIDLIWKSEILDFSVKFAESLMEESFCLQYTKNLLSMGISVVNTKYNKITFVVADIAFILKFSVFDYFIATIDCK